MYLLILCVGIKVMAFQLFCINYSVNVFYVINQSMQNTVYPLGLANWTLLWLCWLNKVVADKAMCSQATHAHCESWS